MWMYSVIAPLLHPVSFTQQTEKWGRGKKEKKEEKNSNRLQLGMSGLRLKRGREENKKENMKEGEEVWGEMKDGWIQNM